MANRDAYYSVVADRVRQPRDFDFDALLLNLILNRVKSHLNTGEPLL